MLTLDLEDHHRIVKAQPVAVEAHHDVANIESWRLFSCGDKITA